MQFFIKILLLLSLSLGFFVKKAISCSPWSALEITNYEINGDFLYIDITSHVAWQCCYTTHIELRCASGNFTGTYTNQTQQICKGSGSGAFDSWNTPEPYPTVQIDISQYCPGTELMFRARENGPDGWGPITATYYITVPGAMDDLTAIAGGTPTSICPGECVDLTGTAENECGNLSYAWSNGDNSQNTTVCPTESTTYTLTVTDAGDACGSRTDTDQITINMDDEIDGGTASVDPENVCIGEDVTLTLIDYIGDIQWQYSDSPTGPWTDIAGGTTNTYIFGPVTEDIYFQAHVSNCVGDEFSNVVQVTAYDAPEINFDATTACLNEPTIFTDQTIDVVGIDSWAWDFGDGNTNNDQDPTHTYAAPGVYTVSLTVQNNQGCHDTYTQDIEVMPIPNANFNFTAVCAEDITQLNDASTVDAPSTITDWEWDINDDGTIEYTDQNPSHDFQSGGAYDVTLTVTSDNGCDDTFTGQVVVHPEPEADFDWNDECLNDAIDFADGSVVATGTITNWNWDFGDGNTDTNQNPTHTYNASGFYDVTLTITTDNGCTDNITESVQVFTLPDIDFSFMENCDGEPVEFTDLSADVDGDMIGWNWDFGDGNTSTDQHPTHTFPDDNTYTVTLQGTTSNGCVAELAQDIIVYPIPVADFSSILVCANNATSLTDESTVAAPSNITVWQWDIDNNGIIDYIDENPSHTFSSGGTYQVNLYVESDFGCSDEVTLDVEVGPIPEADFSATTVCLNEFTEFTDLSTVNTGSIVDWQWDFGDGNNSGDQHPTHTYNASGFYDVTLTITTDNGCTDNITESVQIYTLPDIDFSFNEACDGEVVELSDLSTDVDGDMIGWNWDFGDGNTSNNQNPSHVFPNDNTYTVTLQGITSNGCAAELAQDLTVFPIPVADFSSTTVCANQVTNLTNESTVDTPSTITVWEWDIGNNGIVNYPSENPNHTFNNGGTHEVNLYVETDFGCSDEITLDVVVDPLPVADFESTVVCLGDATNFTDLSSVVSGNIEGWDWDFGDGNSSGNQNPTYTYNNSGTYDVTLQVTTDNGCQHQITLEAEVNAPPEADFDFEEACYYDDLTFTDQSGGDPSIWEWNFGDGNTAIGATAQHNYNQPGTYTVTLTAISNAGCFESISMEVEAFPQPEADFNFEGTCLGETSELFDNSTVVSTGSDAFITDYGWDMGDNTTYTSQDVSHEYASDGLYPVSLTVTTNHGCTHEITQNVPVYPLPSVDFSPTEVCLEEFTSFSDLTTINNDDTQNSLTSWLWNFGDNNTSTEQNPSYAYTESGIFTATLTVTSNHGCVDSLTKEVNVNPLPEVEFVSFDTVGCHPVCATFIDVSSIESGTIETAIWDYGNSEIDTIAANNQTTSMCFENTSNLNVRIFDVSLTLISEKGCSASKTKTGNVQVYPIPVAEFVPSPYPTNIHNTQVQFTNVSIGGNSYQWDFSGLGSSEEEHPSFKFPGDDEGTYPVELIVTNVYGCRDTTIFPITINGEFILYVPNAFTPDGDGINDKFGPVVQGEKISEFDFFIFNRWGELIFESHNSEVWWDGTNKGQPVKQGVYVWKIVARDKYTNEKNEYIGHVTLLR